MAKTSGLGGVIIVQDATPTAQTITNDVTNWSFTSPRNTQNVTGVDKFANEIILLLADFTVTLNGVFNYTGTGGGSDTANSHAVLSTIPSTSVIRSVEFDPVGATTGLPVFKNNCYLTDYQITRASTGELTWQVPGQLADGAVPTWTTHA
jgi:hypothetical protein